MTIQVNKTRRCDVLDEDREERKILRLWSEGCRM